MSLKTSKFHEYSQISLKISRGSFVQTPYVTNCLFVFWLANVPRDMKYYFRDSSKEERLGNTELGTQIRWQKDTHNPEISSVYFAQRVHDCNFNCDTKTPNCKQNQRSAYKKPRFPWYTYLLIVSYVSQLEMWSLLLKRDSMMCTNMIRYVFLDHMVSH
jgi:hypothetical protein